MARRPPIQSYPATFTNERPLRFPLLSHPFGEPDDDEDDELQEDHDQDSGSEEADPTVLSTEDTAMSDFVVRFPPGICQDLAYRFCFARRNSQNFDPVTTLQALLSRAFNPRQVTTSSNGSEDISPGRSHSQDRTLLSATEDISFFGLGYRPENTTILTPATPDEVAEASIWEAVMTAQLSSPQQYHSALGQFVSQASIDTRASRSSPTNSHWHRHANVPRSNYDSLGGINRAMALPSRPTDPMVASPRPSTPTADRRSPRFQSFPISPRRRQRPLSNAMTDNSEQDYSDDSMHPEGAILDMDPEDAGTRHRKRRRAYYPAEPPAASSAQPLILVRTSTGGQTMMNHMSPPRSALLRSASMGGASRFQLRSQQPAFTMSHASPTSHPDSPDLITQFINYSLGADDRGNPPMNPLIMQHLQSTIPPQIKLGSQELIFISEIFPRSFDSTKRSLLTQIFRRTNAHIPAAVSTPLGPRYRKMYYVAEPRPSSPTKAKDLPLGPGKRGWPAGRLPIEVFDIITGYLPRDSVSAMRLVNGEFEMKTSNRLFHTVVVPFRSEIYGLMTHKGDNEELSKKPLRRKGKGKAKAKAKTDLAEEPEENKVVHDGMKVFEAWGPHIKRFAMAFEVDESSLENAPTKGKFEHHTTWWGGYEWPHPFYNRYEFCEGLEKKADEFTCMSKAMSYLNGTKELGLSLDSGLGWLVGPDMSDRAKLFQDKSKVFGRRHSHPELKMTEREELWDSLSNSVTSTRVSHPFYPNQDGSCEVQVLVRGASRQIKFPGANDQPPHYPLIFGGIDLATISNDMDPNEVGRYAVEGPGALVKPNAGHFSNARLKPKDLTSAQQEWLLETEWAQRAFLSSFCMALADNSQTFQYVHTLTISKLSSRYISALRRDDVWKALPNMSDLTINISPDWRNIIKSDTGIVESPSIYPSKAATQFYILLKTHIANLSNIKRLSIGYIGGGEHQVGIFGRNKAVMPAPLTDCTSPTALLEDFPSVFTLPYVEQLTLTNCWITPDILRIFILSMSSAQLRQVSLNSVSLTSDTGPLLRTESVHISPGDGTYDHPQGSPRRHCPSVGNFFTLRRWSTPDPEPSGWATQGQRIGSWGNIINAITPGPTMNFTRYAFTYHDEPPAPCLTNLERITFSSCGYVSLTRFKEFGQRDVGEPVDQLPTCLIKRAVDLYPVMMSHHDPLIGQIVPSIKGEEKEVLETAFQLQMVRPDSVEGAFDNLEDGQPSRGSGRFSGEIGKLVLPALEV